MLSMTTIRTQLFPSGVMICIDAVNIGRDSNTNRPCSPAIKVDPENKQISTWMTKYLDVGEFVMDQSIAIAGASGYFKRER